MRVLQSSFRFGCVVQAIDALANCLPANSEVCGGLLQEPKRNDVQHSLTDRLTQ